MRGEGMADGDRRAFRAARRCHLVGLPTNPRTLSCSIVRYGELRRVMSCVLVRVRVVDFVARRGPVVVVRMLYVEIHLVVCAAMQGMAQEPPHMVP